MPIMPSSVKNPAAWFIWNTDGDVVGVDTCSTLMFSDAFLRLITREQAETPREQRAQAAWMWEYLPGPDQDFTTRAGFLVVLDHHERGRYVWRLTGEQDQHGGWIGVWPD